MFFFTPEVGEGSCGPHRWSLRLILTHIHVRHVRKPLEKSFHEKLVFDVLLTPEVEVGHLTLLYTLSGRLTLELEVPASRNL